MSYFSESLDAQVAGNALSFPTRRYNTKVGGRAERERIEIQASEAKSRQRQEFVEGEDSNDSR